jgi:glutamine synthetase adenylyltransferase
MTFESRITRRPLAHDPGAASEAAGAFADLGPVLAGLLAATAGCSPFLRDLMIREADWLRPALQQSPEPCFTRLLAACDGLAPDLLSPVLRQAKRRVSLLVALADLGGVWTLEEVTGALTAFADRAVQTGLAALAGFLWWRRRLRTLSRTQAQSPRLQPLQSGRRPRAQQGAPGLPLVCRCLLPEPAASDADLPWAV